MTETYFATYAWLPPQTAHATTPSADVRIEVDAGRITTVTPNATRRPDDQLLDGLVLPGFANTHSHAFHRALRGRTHGGGTHSSTASFWTWRDQMYAVAAQLNPDSYHRLARAVFAEMALAGVASVGEFHYLHHAPDGTPYDDPNAMGRALLQAAAEAGIRITLLDTCYLAAGIDTDGTPRPPEGVQRRFSDGDADRWAARTSELRSTAGSTTARIGAAIHSIRAVPQSQLASIVEAATGHSLHLHLSEQPAENEKCLAAYGRTPTAVFDEAGALTSRTTAVHATHLTNKDIATLGSSGTAISMCPSTERDLADGIGPARRLADAGCPITLGSDEHAVIDLLEEARALEMDERLASGERTRFAPVELVNALTTQGHRALGWDDAGTLEPQARADFTVIALDSVRTAGTDPAQAILAATAADIRTVIVDGQVIVQQGRHRLGDVARLLTESIAPLWH